MRDSTVVPWWTLRSRERSCEDLYRCVVVVDEEHRARAEARMTRGLIDGFVAFDGSEPLPLIRAGFIAEEVVGTVFGVEVPATLGIDHGIDLRFASGEAVQVKFRKQPRLAAAFVCRADCPLRVPIGVVVVPGPSKGTMELAAWLDWPTYHDHVIYVDLGRGGKPCPTVEAARLFPIRTLIESRGGTFPT